VSDTIDRTRWRGPGEFFREEFRLKHDPPVSEEDAAARIGWTTEQVREFETGKRTLSIHDAIALERVTGVGTVTWLALQSRR
jgi:plasmid maintenance system antidote protein VapI